MQNIKNLYLNRLKYDIINKFFYKNIKKLPTLKKIILNFGCKTTDLKPLAASLLALELITHQKSKLTFSTKSNILLKIRKGNPVGCKLTLRKIQMFNFLQRLLIEIFPKIKNFSTLNLKFNANSFSFKIAPTDLFSFNEINEHYHLFSILPNLNITIIFSNTNKNELIFILKSIQLPIKS